MLSDVIYLPQGSSLQKSITLNCIMRNIADETKVRNTHKIIKPGYAWRQVPLSDEPSCWPTQFLNCGGKYHINVSLTVGGNGYRWTQVRFSTSMKI